MQYAAKKRGSLLGGHAISILRIQLKKESDKNNTQNNSEQINENSDSDNNKEMSEKNISDSAELNSSES